MRLHRPKDKVNIRESETISIISATICSMIDSIMILTLPFLGFICGVPYISDVSQPWVTLNGLWFNPAVTISMFPWTASRD